MSIKLTLIIKAIDTVDASALVIAAEKINLVRKLDLVCKEQADGF